MAVIDADGLFNGDRFDAVSDSARYAWPYLWVASNRFGRIELNYHRIIGRVFSRFQSVPSEEEFWGWIKEYQKAFLLFVYEVDGSFWGQWHTSEKYLQRHKTAADLASPAPDQNALDAWREEYFQAKRSKNSTKSIAVTNFKNAAKNFAPFAHGIGNGIGNGNSPLPPLRGKDALLLAQENSSETERDTVHGSNGSKGSEDETLIVTIAELIHGRHPRARRDCGAGMVEKQLRAILKHKHIPAGGREAYLRQIDANHASMCASEQWQKDGGEFAKALSNWLAPSKERYDVSIDAEPPASPSSPRMIA